MTFYPSKTPKQPYMAFSSSSSTKTLSSFLLSLLFSLCFVLRTSISEPRATEAGFVCSNNTAKLAQRQIFVNNFLDSLSSLSSQVAFQGYGFAINGTGNVSVYAFGECIEDVTGSDCTVCFAQVKTRIGKCLPYQRLTCGGQVFFDGCYLRYDDHDFSTEIISKGDQTVCGSKEFSGNKTIFKESVVDLMKNLSIQGVENDGFYVGSLRRNNVTVYGLVQCWEYMNASACKACLANGVSRVSSCTPKDEGRALNSGCYLRYSTHKFYNNSVSIVSHGAKHSAVAVGVGVAAGLSTVALLLLLVAAFFIRRRKIVKRQREMKGHRILIMPIIKNSEQNYSYKTLEQATDYFHDSNKLGQGSSGSVYKATLPDGRVVAVKRLFFNTRQWADHFFNEIDLISSVQHKNLVRLLGCSITGPESLLVYEFVPNYSLDCHLFGKKDLRPLSFGERYDIIYGTCEGLAHLHEESNLRIIHRDIKLSNVLLNHDLTPKIADFGLCRLLPNGKTHLSTAIAGTLGYMAPEYVVRGRLTEKTDVYAFGVLLMEVITGKRNTSSFSQDSVCLQHMIWSLYTKQRLHEAVDKGLEGNFTRKDASRVLQIGLLCVQANAELRPSMSTTVRMLRDKYYELPEPTQPPFLNSSSAEITREIQRETSHSLDGSKTNSLTRKSTETLLDAP